MRILGMPFAIRLHRDWLFSVGDDRSLRVWIMHGLQIFENMGIVHVFCFGNF
ncbi:unnamed protein product [Meloidogyne enterolobii]|uniref:Uncharacterized protein n=1 Tax=Meloidogyne enterolobii TaxID=390850 RepID=A0ACB0ZUY1_MELEN